MVTYWPRVLGYSLVSNQTKPDKINMCKIFCISLSRKTTSCLRNNFWPINEAYLNKSDGWLAGNTWNIGPSLSLRKIHSKIILKIYKKYIIKYIRYKKAKFLANHRVYIENISLRLGGNRLRTNKRSLVLTR